uniref:gastrula zinc finger protein XlCGF57.1-like n=1 Tax=Semicossyphus pulcher TaxID=241346 RepID=UPI0037E71516
MSSIQLLRVLVNERLSAAAEEIFEAVKKTIAGYEEEILLSKREIRRQRRMLQTVSKTEIKLNKHSDQPQLALSVWDEDFPCDEQDHCDQEWSPSLDHDDDESPHAEKSQDGPPSSQEVELQEDTTIRFIFTPPYVKNELDPLQSDCQSSKGEGDPLPSTSAELEHPKVEDEGKDDASSHSSATDDSGDEWRGSAISQSDESENDSTSKRKVPRQPMAPKLHPTKRLKSPICCKVCGKAFHAKVSLVNHMEVHPKDVCGVCGERFETEESFQVHLKTHVKAEVCSVCGKCFGASSSLETHMRIHTGEKPFNCSECGKSFNCRHNMMRHIRIHTGERPYPCTVCGKCFNDYSTLKRHLLVHVHNKNRESTSANENEISEDGEKKTKTSSPKKQTTRTICEVCGKMFHSMVSLVNHAKSHSTDLCGVCGTHFDSEENLKLHLKTHKNGKVCEVCGKCFDSQGNLEMHMRIHTGEKPFLCSECGKSFNCRHNMMRHIRTHTGEKPYLCNICGRCFSDHSTLKQHSSTHTGEKPHRCEICGKGFHRKTYVRLHMKSHSTEK